MREEIFYLAYHLHWSRTEIMNLAIPERHDYIRMLAHRISADSEMAEQLYARLLRGRAG